MPSTNTKKENSCWPCRLNNGQTMPCLMLLGKKKVVSSFTLFIKIVALLQHCIGLSCYVTNIISWHFFKFGLYMTTCFVHCRFKTTSLLWWFCLGSRAEHDLTTFDSMYDHCETQKFQNRLRLHENFRYLMHVWADNSHVYWLLETIFLYDIIYASGPPITNNILYYM
jgi:hypothetical protein